MMPVAPENPADPEGIGPRLYRAISRKLLRLWDTPEGELPHSLPVFLLRAASGVYRLGLRYDQARARKRAEGLPVFVISIGNLVAGGTGKTPLTLWITRFLLEQGFRPAVLSRGYGKKVEGPMQVPPEGDPFKQSEFYGDEAVLMSKAMPEVPVWVGTRRVLSGRAALSGNNGIDTLVLDDGFQHLAIHRDLDLVLLDGQRPFGNGYTLPLGPLREPASSLARADAVIVTRAKPGAELEKLRSILRTFAPGKPVFSCRHAITGFRTIRENELINIESLRGRKVAAFAGLANPRAFFDGLAHLGIRVCSAFSFPDHYRYGEADLAGVVNEASRGGAEFVVTTAKDSVRVPSGCRTDFLVAEMEIDLGQDEIRFREFLLGALFKPG